MRWIVLLGITTIGVLSGVPAARAQSFDGTYAGTLACPALPGGAPLRTPFMLTVSGGRASYEREIRSPGAAGGQTGSYERGGGTVSPAGDVSLRGACQGSFTCDAEYRGQLTGGPIRLTGLSAGGRASATPPGTARSSSPRSPRRRTAVALSRRSKWRLDR